MKIKLRKYRILITNPHNNSVKILLFWAKNIDDMCKQVEEMKGNQEVWTIFNASKWANLKKILKWKLDHKLD